MSLLAALHTDLGKITLHHTGRGYETRRTYTNLITGEPEVERVPQDRASAERWWLQCAERGVVRRRFPREVGT